MRLSASSLAAINISIRDCRPVEIGPITQGETTIRITTSKAGPSWGCPMIVTLWGHRQGMNWHRHMESVSELEKELLAICHY